jgi:hypothetical protein
LTEVEIHKMHYALHGVCVLDIYGEKRKVNSFQLTEYLGCADLETASRKRNRFGSKEGAGQAH